MVEHLNLEHLGSIPTGGTMLCPCARHINSPRVVVKKGTSMIRKRRNQKEIPTPKTEVEKNKLTISYLYLENIS